jgi:hypothetical protein
MGRGSLRRGVGPLFKWDEERRSRSAASWTHTPSEDVKVDSSYYR